MINVGGKDTHSNLSAKILSKNEIQRDTQAMNHNLPKRTFGTCDATGEEEVLWLTLLWSSVASRHHVVVIPWSNVVVQHVKLLRAPSANALRRLKSLLCRHQLPLYQHKRFMSAVCFGVFPIVCCDSFARSCTSSCRGACKVTRGCWTSELECSEVLCWHGGRLSIKKKLQAGWDPFLPCREVTEQRCSSAFGW